MSRKVISLAILLLIIASIIPLPKSYAATDSKSYPLGVSDIDTIAINTW